MIRRSAGIILFVSGLLTLALPWLYTGMLGRPVIYYIAGGLMVIGGLILILYTPKVIDNEMSRQHINYLLRYGEKMIVRVSDCEILGNNYAEEQDRYNTGHTMTKTETSIMTLDALTDETRNTKLVEINESVIVYRTNDKDFYSPVIPTDRISLTFLLEAQKEVIIYVHPFNINDYFFDIRFLNEHLS